MKFTLIALTSVAVVLGIITYFALFSGPQMIQPNQTSNQQVAQTSPQASSTTSTSTASSSPVVTTGGVSATGSTQLYQANFTAPYPITWSQGQQQLAITGATFQNNQLVLNVSIQMGADAQCVPINLRMIIDEQGDMQAPSSPTGPNFPLGNNGDCKGDSQTAYGESVTFDTTSLMLPLLLSTGDQTNGFLEVATTTGNGLQISFPQKNG